MEKINRSSLTLRLPAPLRDWIANKAAENFTSINDEIVRMIRERMKNEKGEATA